VLLFPNTLNRIPNRKNLAELEIFASAAVTKGLRAAAPIERWKLGTQKRSADFLLLALLPTRTWPILRQQSDVQTALKANFAMKNDSKPPFTIFQNIEKQRE